MTQSLAFVINVVFLFFSYVVSFFQLVYEANPKKKTKSIYKVFNPLSCNKLHYEFLGQFVFFLYWDVSFRLRTVALWGPVRSTRRMTTPCRCSSTTTALSSWRSSPARGVHQSNHCMCQKLDVYCQSMLSMSCEWIVFVFFFSYVTDAENSCNDYWEQAIYFFFYSITGVEALILHVVLIYSQAWHESFPKKSETCVSPGRKVQLFIMIATKVTSAYRTKASSLLMLIFQWYQLWQAAATNSGSFSACWKDRQGEEGDFF